MFKQLTRKSDKISDNPAVRPKVTERPAGGHFEKRSKIIYI